MAAGKQAVGNRLYVFSSNGGAKTTAACVIDAHGEQKLFGNGFQLQAGQRVVFYVEQGAAMKYHNGVVSFNNPGQNFSYTNALEAIATGRATEESHVDGPGNCPDYNLTKIQKSSTGLLNGAWSNFIGERSDVTYSSLEKFIDYYPNCCDVVTIRNRGALAITLGEVIAELTQNGYPYTEFRCSFCRSRQLGALWQPSAPNRHVTGSKRPNALGGGRY